MLPSSDLKMTPYTAPSRGFSKTNADLPQSNPLFMPQVQEKQNENVLIMASGVKKRWGDPITANPGMGGQS